MTILKKLRSNRGMSQKELADKSGVKVRVIQHYEQGSRDLNHARLDTIMRIALALDCAVIDIIDDPEFLELIENVRIK